MRALRRTFDRRDEGKRARIDENTLRRDGLIAVRASNAHGMRIDKRCLSVYDDSTRARHLGVVLFAQHFREAAFLCNRRTIALRLCRKVAARRRRKTRAVLQRLRRDAGDIDAGAAVALL